MCLPLAIEAVWVLIPPLEEIIMQTSRRRFLEGAAVGTAVVSVPQVFMGCAKNGLVPATKTPNTTGAMGSNYFEAFGVDRGVISRVIARGLARGGDYCDVFVQHRVEHRVVMEDGEVSRASSTVSLGAGVRVIKGDATGYAFTEDLSEKALMAAASTACVVADGPATIRPRPFEVTTAPNRYRVAVPWTEVGIDKKIPIVLRAESVARAEPGIVKVNVALDDETTRILLADSDGKFILDDQPMTVLSVRCVGEKAGKTETSWDSFGGREGVNYFTQDKIDAVARKASKITMLLFDAEQPPAGEYPVVLAPGIPGILLHEAIGHGMEADFNRKGTSVYADKMGKRIASPHVTIVDDGTNDRLRGSINIDDEGTETQRTVLVQNGILQSYMHDRISSKHYNVQPTGSGRRESFRFPPVPRMRNTYMLNGPHKPEEIIASVKRGLYAEMFTNGQVQIGAGDFTFYLKHGRMIENGKLTRVVKDSNLIGNGPKVLEHVDMVGDDLKMHYGAGYCGKDGQMVPVGFGLPTIRVEAISVGGKRA